MTSRIPAWQDGSAGVVPAEVLLVAGTRPEAIKLAPLALAMTRAGRLRPRLLAAGQHPTMVPDALAAFGLTPDDTLDLHRRNGSLAELAAAVVIGIEDLLAERPPSVVVVQGDTTTAAMAAQAAFWRRIPVVHLEAGLRSHDLGAPFPEEANRKIIGQIADAHLAPTDDAAANLAAEGIAGQSVLTIGNTVVDAVRYVAEQDADSGDPVLEALLRRVRSGQRRLVLVTAHRRESWGLALDCVLRAVAELVTVHPDIEVVLPVHPNPVVGEQVRRILGGRERVTLTEPLPYQQLARLLSVATLVLSDSGGIQEEAPTFGVPVLVLRELTERQEAIDAGCAVLVGTDHHRITHAAGLLLANEQARRSMVAPGNPFGDGESGERAEQAIAWLLGLSAEPPEPFLSPRIACAAGGSTSDAA